MLICLDLHNGNTMYICPNLYNIMLFINNFKNLFMLLFEYYIMEPLLAKISDQKRLSKTAQAK